nr:MAG TPA: hypothetical protein [Caudoviricetes sp.]
MLIVRKAKANLPVCTVYGYVCKLKFAMKFKILERRTSDDESRVNAGGAPTLTPTKARRSKAAFVKSAITKGAKHKSQEIRANRRKAKTRSKRWK